MTMHVRSPPPSAPQAGPAHVLSVETASPAAVARAIAVMEVIGEQFRIPLFRAVPRGEIAFTVLNPGQAPPLAKLERTGRPAIIVLTSDDDTTRLGPDGWPHAARILRWAKAAMLHGTGGRPEHYELAIEGAKVHRRVVLVETCTAHIEAWTTLARRTMAPERILRMQPPDGGVHPVPMPRERFH